MRLLCTRTGIVLLCLTLSLLACATAGGSTALPPSPAKETAVIPTIAESVSPTPDGDSIATPDEMAAPSEESLIPTPESCTPESDFVADVTIPDRSPAVPGTSFVKTWRLRNTGTCPWNSEYHLVQLNGEYLTANPDEIPLPDVAPGEEVDISVTLTLAAGAPAGTEQKAQFQLRTPSRQFFGTRPYVLIIVKSANSEGVGNISGQVWLDYCSVKPNGSTAGSCVKKQDGTYRADGVFNWNTNEKLLGGIRVVLRSNDCAGSIVATDLTSDADPTTGDYTFYNLAPGSYCVSIDSLDATNSSILIPGSWTFPTGFYDKTVAYAAAQLKAGQNIVLDFGWDYQLD